MSGKACGGSPGEIHATRLLSLTIDLPDRARGRGCARRATRCSGLRGGLPPRDNSRRRRGTGGAPASAPPIQADEIIDSAAKRGVAIVRRQRKLLAELLGIAEVTLEELREMAVISRETLGEKRTKAQAQLVAALSKARLDGMRAVSQVLSQAIPLERQAYSLDDDKGGTIAIKYVAPAYKKPPYSGLSEDQWG